MKLSNCEARMKRAGFHFRAAGPRFLEYRNASGVELQCAVDPFGRVTWIYVCANGDRNRGFRTLKPALETALKLAHDIETGYIYRVGHLDVYQGGAA